MGRENLLSQPSNLSCPRGFLPDIEVCFAQDAWINDKPNDEPADDLYSGLDPGLCRQEDSAS
jgi:hypothetical protein